LEGECLVELTLQGATEGEPAQDVEGEMKNAQGAKDGIFGGEM